MNTQEQLKENFHYSPESGVFTNKTTRARAVKGIESGFNRKCVTGGVYRIIGFDNTEYKAHRLAFLYMNGSLPIDEIDHIDGDTLNNSWVNLREVTRIVNSQNMPKRCDNKSGITGVSWFKPANRWQAIIWVKKKMIHLGYSHDFFEVCCRRKSAELKYGFHKNHGRNKCLSL